LALAAALAAALRPGRLPVLPRARLGRGAQPARKRCDPRLERAPARRLRHAVGSLGLGRVEDAREQPRTTRKLAWWLTLVAVLAVGNYVARFGSGKPPKDVLYH